MTLTTLPDLITVRSCNTLVLQIRKLNKREDRRERRRKAAAAQPLPSQL
jgi:hypothetical protein